MNQEETLYFQLSEFAGLDKFFRRNLMNSLSGFKSVNLVGTISKEQKTNLAIFSQIFHLGATPALMGMIVRPDTVPRDTLSNIEATQYYTFNHIQSDFYRQAHQTSARYENSEFEATGLTPEYSENHPAPYVKESSIKIGLKLEEKQKLEINGTIFLIGSVQEIFLPKNCISNDGWIDLEKAGTITCAGLDAYFEGKRLERLSYAKPDQALKIIKD